MFLRQRYMASEYVVSHCENFPLANILKNLHAQSYLTLKQNRLAATDYARFLSEGALQSLQKYIDGENDPLFLSVMLEGFRAMNATYRIGIQRSEFQANYCKFEDKKRKAN